MLSDLVSYRQTSGDYYIQEKNLSGSGIGYGIAEDRKVTTILAIPYNPYHPEPYSRFTLQGVLDGDKELFVAEKFWDFLAGDGTYERLLNIFNEVGTEFKEKIQDKIKEVAKEKMELETRQN